MKRYLLKGFFLLLALILTSCQSDINESLKACNSKDPHSKFDVENHSVKVFWPNDKVKPDIWEGPICITKISSKSTCIQDLSLISELKFNLNNNSLSMLVFSGSKGRTVQLNLDNCDIINAKLNN